MKLDLIKKVVLFLFLVSLSAPFLVKAVTIPNPLCPCPPTDPNYPNCVCNMTFADIIDKIINFIFYVAIAIFPIMAIVAGFFFLSSGGDPTKVKTAKNILLYSVIGLMIVLLAKGLISVIKQIIGMS